MTLKTTRLVRNMIGIGGTVCAGTFAFSLASSRSSISGIHTLNSEYGEPKAKIKPSKITSINHIEDLEYAEGCKFLFYDENKKRDVFNNGSFEDARGAEKTIKGVVESAQKNIDKCKNGSYVFIDSATAATSKQ